MTGQMTYHNLVGGPSIGFAVCFLRLSAYRCSKLGMKLLETEDETLANCNVFCYDDNRKH